MSISDIDEPALLFLEAIARRGAHLYLSQNPARSLPQRQRSVPILQGQDQSGPVLGCRSHHPESARRIERSIKFASPLPSLPPPEDRSPRRSAYREIHAPTRAAPRRAPLSSRYPRKPPFGVEAENRWYCGEKVIDILYHLLVQN